MVVTPKREKVAALLCARHKINDIIALAGMSRSLVDTVKKLLKTGAKLDKRSRKPRTSTISGPPDSFLVSKRASKQHQPSQ